MACDVVVGTIQPPRTAAASQGFRGGLKESNMPMMEFDMTTAFPTLAASAFKPIATTAASLIAKVTHEFPSQKVVIVIYKVWHQGHGDVVVVVVAVYTIEIDRNVHLNMSRATYRHQRELFRNFGGKKEK